MNARQAVLEERLKEAQERLASQPRGTVEWQDARAAVRHLERLLLSADDLPPTSTRSGRETSRR